MKYRLIFVFALLCASVATAKVQLPQLMQTGMVMQRNAEVPVWGWADAGENVTVTFKKKVYTATAGTDGRWQVVLPRQKAGGPYEINVCGKDGVPQVISDVLFGDVWLCSGQSNIDVTIERVYPQYGRIIDDYENQKIRMFRVQTDYDTHGPKRDLKPTTINWKHVNKQNAWLFSAVGYFLGREMFEKTGVPQGIIVNSLGGTPIQAWLCADTLQKHFPDEWQRTLFYQDDNMVQAMQQANRKAQERWQRLMDESDPGLSKGFMDLDFDDSMWEQKKVFSLQTNNRPQSVNLSREQRYYGSCWARQNVTIDKAHAGQQARLLVGTLYDADQTYMNGKQVGSTGYQYPPRRYTIPAGLLQEGKNALTVRFITKGGAPHFIPEKPYKLIFDDGTEVNLTDKWRICEGARMPQSPAVDAGGQNLPSVLYNAMLSPLAPYAIQGVVWYQGESNTGGDARNYETWLTELVSGWRQLWKQPDLPFVVVQLANFMEPSQKPQNTGWSLVREAQRRVALQQQNVELACIIDLGEAVDIHPLRKREVAQRVALGFEHILWNKSSLLSPQVLFARADGDKVILTLDQSLREDGPLYEFEVAGPDGTYLPAQAKALGKVITISSPVAQPAMIRYAWKNNPDRANVFSRSGLPMSPLQFPVQP